MTAPIQLKIGDRVEVWLTTGVRGEFTAEVLAFDKCKCNCLKLLILNHPSGKQFTLEHQDFITLRSIR